MAPKGGNAKKESGRAKKAENETKKAQAADAERVRARTQDRSCPDPTKSHRSARRQRPGAMTVSRAGRRRRLTRRSAARPNLNASGRTHGFSPRRKLVLHPNPSLLPKPVRASSLSSLQGQELLPLGEDWVKARAGLGVISLRRSRHIMRRVSIMLWICWRL